MIKIDKTNAHLWLYSAVFFSVTICFLIKLLGFYQILPWNVGYNDVMPWHERSFTEGFPYVDKGFEYPVITGLVIHAASQSSIPIYFIVNYLVFVLAALIATKYLYLLSKHYKVPIKNLFLFWALAPSMIWFSYFNWDILTVMFVILGLYYFKENKNILGAVFIGLGVSTKLYPLLFFFPILLHRDFKTWVKVGVTFTLTFLATNGFFMLISFQNWFYTYGFHSARPPNIDSFWFVFAQFVPTNISTMNLLTFVVFAVIYFIVLLYFRKRDAIYLCFAGLLLFLIFNKVFSPQYILWILPFIALMNLSNKLFYSLEVVNLVVLFTTLSHIFSGLEFSGSFALSMLAVVIRHVLLVALLYVVVKELRNPAKVS